ncbi:hypothetical protein REIS_0869 [Rickettsia endosymbiont of Ixodes scapularis]|nr:hypothetical protein REIS_0869 [Rickettsia endosymbiont of Ixodes scapularis]
MLAQIFVYYIQIKTSINDVTENIKNSLKIPCNTVFCWHLNLFYTII